MMVLIDKINKQGEINMNKTLFNEIINSKLGEGFKQTLKEKTPEIKQLSDKNFGEDMTNLMMLVINKRDK